MANQSRKDFPAAFECFATLKHHYGNDFKAWLHTDVPLRYWNVYALATDYGVTDCLTVTSNLSDESLSMLYSACECTFLPSAGEGFGYPIAESMFCGTACVVTDYGGGAELVPADCRVSPVTYRVDTQHNCRRAVLSGYAFAEKVKEQVQRKKDDWECRAKEIAYSVNHLNWNNLKHLWVSWLKAGLR
jgi:glycosyltransferase involved in cell wall biosynthesis